MIRSCVLETCRNTFQAKRSDARYCSASCRAAASRLRRAAGISSTISPVRRLSPAPARPTPSVAVVPPSLIQELSMLRDRLEALERRILLDRKATTERIELHDHSLEGLKHALTTLQKRLKELGTQGVESERSITRLSRQVEEFEERSPPQPPTNPDNELNRRLGKVENLIAQMSRELHAQARRINKLDQSAADAVLVLARLRE